jgi:hypothetical protein
MAYVKRDPFAREEIHKTRERTAECAWCGQVDPDRPDTERLVGRPPHRIYRFRIETDGGRRSEDVKTFCTLACRTAYYG